MQSLPEKIEYAKENTDAMNSLVTEYLPFIRQEAGKQTTLGIDYDDRVSLGMAAFMRSVQQYNPGRGNFISYAATSIRNSLFDEAKKQSQHTRYNVPLEPDADAEDENTVSFQQAAATQAYQRQLQSQALAEEIDLLEELLAPFGIDFDSLEEISPKHRRASLQCIRVGRALAADGDMADQLEKTGQVPVSALAKRTGISAKTIAKFRKYIITVALVYRCEFRGIERFLPKEEGVEP